MANADAAQGLDPGSGDATPSPGPGASQGSSATSASPPTAPGSSPGPPPAPQLERGSAATAWAQNCPQGSVYACVTGTWQVKAPPADGNFPPLRFQSEHFALYWEVGEVSDDQLRASVTNLERVYTNHTQRVGFIEPSCQESAKSKVNIHLKKGIGLSGGATSDGNPAIWADPDNTAKDVYGVAHEFSHALQVGSGGLRRTTLVGWFWECHAEFMAHSMPDWRDSNVGCTELSVNYPHIYLGSTRDRYCNWQFLDYYKDRFCMQAVNEIWTKAAKDGDPQQAKEDPFSVMARSRNWSVDQLNDFFGEWMMHNVTWDYRDPDGNDHGKVYRKMYGLPTSLDDPAQLRHLRLTRLDVLDAGRGRFAVPFDHAPQRWGYNQVRMEPKKGATEVMVSFHGSVQQQPATTQLGDYPNLPDTVGSPASDWRWGLVAVDATGTQARYSSLQRGAAATVRLAIDAKDAAVYLMVMGTPSIQQKIIWDQMYYTIYRYPWWVEVAGATPQTLHPAAVAKKNGQLWRNGGGWVAQEAMVEPGAYVGPQAVVLGGKVAAGARIEDRAVIVDADIRDQAVIGGISILSNGIVVGGQARIRSVFQPPGSFEPGQVVGGTAMLLGDIELRVAQIQVERGVFYGFVAPSVLPIPNYGMARTEPMPEVTEVPKNP